MSNHKKKKYKDLTAHKEPKTAQKSPAINICDELINTFDREPQEKAKLEWQNIFGKSNNDKNKFDIFKQNNTKCDPTASIKDGCPYISRIIESLSYYQSLLLETDDHTKIKQLKKDQQKLIRFYTETYTQILDDFIHIIEHHHNDLDELYDLAVSAGSLGMCEVLICKRSQRHNRDRTKVISDQIPQDIVDHKQNIIEHDFDVDESVGSISNIDDTDDSDYLYSCSSAQESDYTDDENVEYYDLGRTDCELQFIFIRDLFDSIHCYILHQYDFGYQIRNEDKQKFLENKNTNIDSYNDELYQFISNVIKQKKKIMNDEQFPRFSKQNKYSIDQQQSNFYMFDDTRVNNDSTTFMDHLLAQITDALNIEQAAAVKQFFDEEEYDSDAVEQDIINQMNVNMHEEVASNIKHIEFELGLLQPHVYAISKEYVAEKLSWNGAFSTGFTYYYWDYYKTPIETQKTSLPKLIYNVMDYGGYHRHDLYISKKYTNLKQELQQNMIYALTPQQFELSLLKANYCINTRKARRMRAKIVTNIELHYDIKPGTRLKASNLLSVILYSDWSELCTEFSRTFRKLQIHEPLFHAKKRNAEYAIWSRILRETVELFGCVFDDRDRENYLAGPFYSGVSCKMSIPQFSIRLSGPTSTSTHIEVAERFGGDDGMIIELNNNGEISSGALRGFSCSWVSNYTGEAEYLFIGGHAPLKIDSVILKVDSAVHNYGLFFQPLYYFDCMVNGSVFAYQTAPCHVIKNVDKCYTVLQNLIHHKLAIHGFTNQYPSYINNTFESFINSKTQIILNLMEFQTSFGKLKDLLIHKMSLNATQATSETNLCKITVFRLFKNAKNIIIYTTRKDKPYFHTNFNILSLLCMFSEISEKEDLSNEFKISIIAKQTARSNQSWLSIAWNKLDSSIKNAWNVSFSEGMDGTHCVTIKSDEHSSIKKLPTLKSVILPCIEKLTSQTFSDDIIDNIIEYTIGVDLGRFIKGPMTQQNFIRFKHHLETQLDTELIVHDQSNKGNYHFGTFRNIVIEDENKMNLKSQVVKPVLNEISDERDDKMKIQNRINKYFNNFFGNMFLGFRIIMPDGNKIYGRSQSVSWYHHDGYLWLYGIRAYENTIRIISVFFSADVLYDNSRFGHVTWEFTSSDE